MAKQHKYTKSKLSHFFDYSEDKISAEDRHAFEKQLQADPFDLEAADGFSLVSRSEAEKDLASSSKKIKNRINRRNRIAWYSAAAAFASMLIVGSIFLDLSDINIKEDDAFQEKVQKAKESHVSSNEKGDEQKIDEITSGQKAPAVEKKIVQEKTSPIETIQTDNSSKTITEKNTTDDTPNTTVSANEVSEKKEAMLAAKKEETARLTQEVDKQKAEVATEKGAEIEGYVEDNAFAWEMMSDDATEGRYDVQKNRKVIMQESQAVQYDLISATEPISASNTVSGIITGVVISAADMNPVPGVNLNIKGTEIGTVTDFNGKFQLNTDELHKGTVIASYIGMETEEFPFFDGETIEIAMSPNEVSLDEVVVVGYGFSAQKEESGAATEIDNLDNSIEYKSACPVDGISDFKDYIDSTLVNPDLGENRDKSVVILKFYISEEGRPFDFKVIKSPGEEFSQEAIRVIEEGPDWLPASRYGKYINESVRLRIVFR